jgi:DNA-binding NtrC family response regulator
MLFLITWHELSRDGQMIVNTLIIDDDKEIRDSLRIILEAEGYSVETAENGKMAIRICEKAPFDVALVDVELPDIKGTQLLSKIKKIQPKMVKIIITGHPTIENAAQAVNEKADGYILKPFNAEQLLEMIKRLIEEKKNEYFHMFAEVERAKQNTPIFKYQHPDKW